VLGVTCVALVSWNFFREESRSDGTTTRSGHLECLEWNGLLERPTLVEFATAPGQTVLVSGRFFCGGADRKMDCTGSALVVTVDTVVAVGYCVVRKERDSLCIVLALF
jgi:hypothetical protein